jgi:hypothetical protein
LNKTVDSEFASHPAISILWTPSRASSRAHLRALHRTTPLLGAASSVLLLPHPHPSPCESFSAPEIQQAIPAATNDVSSNLKCRNMTPRRDKRTCGCIQRAAQPFENSVLTNAWAHCPRRLAAPPSTLYLHTAVNRTRDRGDRRRSPALENRHDGSGARPRYASYGVCAAGGGGGGLRRLSHASDTKRGGFGWAQ